jgi:hypothetical protein
MRAMVPLRDHLVISCKILQCIGKLAAATQGSNAMFGYQGFRWR